MATSAAVAVALLAGCSNDEGNFDEPRRTNEELIAERNMLREEAFASPFVDAAMLPTSGSATYDGVMAIDLTGGEVVEGEAPRRLAGDLEMEVDFGRSTDAVSGQAGNFVNHDGEEFDGSLGISNGVIDRQNDLGEYAFEHHYTADLDGTLTNEGGGEYEFDGDMAGYFYGDGSEPDYVSGGLDGTYTTPDGDDRGFQGNLIGER